MLRLSLRRLCWDLKHKRLNSYGDSIEIFKLDLLRCQSVKVKLNGDIFWLRCSTAVVVNPRCLKSLYKNNSELYMSCEVDKYLLLCTTYILLMVPAVPSNTTWSPVCIRSVAAGVLTMHGMPHSRATTAPWDNKPPSSVTSPLIRVK